MTQINFWPILVSSIAAFVIGALWYSPVLFGKEWMRLKGISDKDLSDEDKKKGMWKLYLIQFVSTLVFFTVLGFLISVTGSASVSDGLFLAFIAWIGFSVTTTVGDIIWNQTPMKLVLITETCTLLNWLIGGAIIAGWK